MERYGEGTDLVSWPPSFTQTERRREAGDGGERWRRRCTETQGRGRSGEEGGGGHGVRMDGDKVGRCGGYYAGW
jgi:hypothetical protein